MSYFARVVESEIVGTLYSPLDDALLMAQHQSLGQTLVPITLTEYASPTLNQTRYYKNGALHERDAALNAHSIWNNDLAIWQVNLPMLKAEKSASITESCKNEIIGGFISNALGADYLYPNNAEDQTNLSGTVLMSTLPTQPPGAVYLFKCKSADGIWDFRPHTAAQVQQVGAASYAFILAARVKNATLQAQIIAATTSAQVEAVQW